MANNNSIFVPQTFNGARMVNVTKRTLTSSTSNSSTETAASSHPPPPPPPPPDATNAPSNEHKKDSKPDTNLVNVSPKAKAIAIKPYASSQSVIDTRAKSSNTNRASPSSLSSSKTPAMQKLEQPQQAAPIPVQSRAPQVVQPLVHPQVIIQPSFPGPYDVVGYDRVWSEASVAVLIQLHRKHYNGVTSMDADQYKAAWAALTSEYNTITADNRSTPALIKKWGKLMAKYNAERAFLIMPRPQGLQQPVPTVSYWNHFQYMDSYLSHVPIPENCILKRKRREDSEDEFDKAVAVATPTPHSTSAKRPRISADPNMELLETQRVFMEKILDKQNTQIEMMRANAESMHKMNMKFVNICEKACTRSQANEARYLNLLEKCLIINNNNNNKNHKKDLAAAMINDMVPTKEASPRPDSPTISTHSSASSELAKADELDK